MKPTVQEEPENPLRRPSYKLHPDRLEHLQTSDKSQVREEADVRELPGRAARTRELRTALHSSGRPQT